jgi:hypothetical protein
MPSKNVAQPGEQKKNEHTRKDVVNGEVVGPDWQRNHRAGESKELEDDPSVDIAY